MRYTNTDTCYDVCQSPWQRGAAFCFEKRTRRSVKFECHYFANEDILCNLWHHNEHVSDSEIAPATTTRANLKQSTSVCPSRERLPHFLSNNPTMQLFRSTRWQQIWKGRSKEPRKPSCPFFYSWVRMFWRKDYCFQWLEDAYNYCKKLTSFPGRFWSYNMWCYVVLFLSSFTV